MNIIRSNKDLIASLDLGNKHEYLYFWGHNTSKVGIGSTCLSQWYPASFTVVGTKFLTAEHGMMAGKAIIFNDDDSAKKIIDSLHPSDAKRLGRKIKNFNESIWDESKFNIVVSTNMEKFKQNPELRKFLLDTGEKILVEASPHDTVWGIGLSDTDKRISDPRNWNGSNLLGYALMEVRDILRNKEVDAISSQPIPPQSILENNPPVSDVIYSSFIPLAVPGNYQIPDTTVNESFKNMWRGKLSADTDTNNKFKLAANFKLNEKKKKRALIEQRLKEEQAKSSAYIGWKKWI